MAEHLTNQQIEAYCNRAMQPADLISADRHLADCALCRTQLIDYKQSSSAMIASLQKSLKSSATKPLQHVSYEMLEDYVNGKSDHIDREIIEDHIKICQQCAWEFDDLKSFATMIHKESDLSERSDVRLKDLGSNQT